jgi:hypothetical protein
MKENQSFFSLFLNMQEKEAIQPRLKNAHSRAYRAITTYIINQSTQLLPFPSPLQTLMKKYTA